MKKFVVELVGTTVVSLVAVPLVFIGMGVTGHVWSTKVEPKLKKKNKKSTEMKES